MKMNTKTMFLFVAASLFVCPVAVFSMDDAMMEEAVESASMAMELSGTVVSVDAEANEVVVEYQVEGEEAMQAVLGLSEGAKLEKNGEAISASDLTAGDKVVVTYQVGDNDSKVVETLAVQE